MNTIHLSPSAHPPQPSGMPRALSAIPERTPRASAADRIAMRIGLWLLLWSTRPSETPEQTRARYERQRLAAAARAEHEAQIQRITLVYGLGGMR
ncbi:hypothetical protein GCM10017576_00870 [Microbacterium barkeri]|uniref:Uncharacterized protein n=1 Tax=Microbacterium barkeri TaxID=33917 RepID=A0A9W6H0E1_9MICO|nr:hypothetical protein [Microbacterium barkeri]MDR6875841.1 hypothetical protein [Microbacterium barkeri]GLJ59958.1 hypothetical protein GCM10017576_00870 [Microbacterium barkeri]